MFKRFAMAFSAFLKNGTVRLNESFRIEFYSDKCPTFKMQPVLDVKVNYTYN